jgi:hypothetical protein
MDDIKYFRTDRPEAVARDLVARHGRCWVDGNWTLVKYRLDPPKLGHVQKYYVGRSRSARDLQNWARFGGLAIETWRERPYRNTNPSTPALLFLECPMSIAELEARSLHCRGVVVVYRPLSWDLWDSWVELSSPGEDACRRFHAGLEYLHQRITVEQAAITSAMGYDTVDTVPVSLADHRNALRLARAMGVLDELLSAECQPVNLILRPEHGELLETWEAIERRAPQGAGWRVVSDDLFPGYHNWRFELMQMARMGYVFLGEPQAFIKLDRQPQFERAQVIHDDALIRFREVARLVMSWPSYPLDHLPDPIKTRRPRRSKRKPDEGSAEEIIARGRALLAKSATAQAPQPAEAPLNAASARRPSPLRTSAPTSTDCSILLIATPARRDESSGAEPRTGGARIRRRDLGTEGNA